MMLLMLGSRMRVFSSNLWVPRFLYFCWWSLVMGRERPLQKFPWFWDCNSWSLPLWRYWFPCSHIGCRCSTERPKFIYLEPLEAHSTCFPSCRPLFFFQDVLLLVSNVVDLGLCCLDTGTKICVASSPVDSRTRLPWCLMWTALFWCLTWIFAITQHGLWFWWKRNLIYFGSESIELVSFVSSSGIRPSLTLITCKLLLFSVFNWKKGNVILQQYRVFSCGWNTLTCISDLILCASSVDDVKFVLGER